MKKSHTDGKQSIGLGVIGCSDIFVRAHQLGLAALENQFELSALCDIDQPKLAAFGSKYGIDNLYTDYRELLNNPRIEAVLVTTPTSVHAELTSIALHAGKHVLCEKPMAMTLAECDRMIAARKQSGQVLQLAFMSRHNAAWKKNPGDDSVRRNR